MSDPRPWSFFLRLTAHPPPLHLLSVSLPTDPYASSFRIALAAQTSIAASALLASQIYAARSSLPPPPVHVDARLAAFEFHSEAYCTVNQQPLPQVWDPLAGLYPTRDGHVRVHTNFPHHKHALLASLGLPDSAQRPQVAHEISKHDSFVLEQSVTQLGGCVVALRSLQEWNNHPQAHAVDSLDGPVSLSQIAHSPPVSWPTSQISPHKPLSGIRVLDLSRVIAGPVAGRILAGYGADVLLVNSPNLPTLPGLDPDTTRGKRSTFLDLDNPSHKQTFMSLLQSADVLLQAYRPGSLQAKGLSIDNILKHNPNIIIANLSAWGSKGPWSDRRGFDSLVQTATGFNVDEGQDYQNFLNSNLSGEQVPKPLPCQALDHASGYFLSCGIQQALLQRAKQGGSWRVDVSLAETGKWIRQLGRTEPQDRPWKISNPTLQDAQNEGYIHTLTRSPDNSTLQYLAHAAKIDHTNIHWQTAPSHIGVDDPEWISI